MTRTRTCSASHARPQSVNSASTSRHVPCALALSRAQSPGYRPSARPKLDFQHCCANCGTCPVANGHSCGPPSAQPFQGRYLWPLIRSWPGSDAQPVIGPVAGISWPSKVGKSVRCTSCFPTKLCGRCAGRIWRVFRAPREHSLENANREGVGGSCTCGASSAKRCPLLSQLVSMCMFSEDRRSR